MKTQFFNIFAVSGTMAFASTVFFNSITSPLANGLHIERKVGIVSPTNFPGNYKLYVTGRILCEKVKVAINNSAGWADFVYKPGYKLISISGLETFITENGHLPNIPTEAEVIADGIDVDTINSKLLEMIEELALYINSLNKRIETLEKGQ